MFKFKIILDYFYRTGAKGPIIESNQRAKWLSMYAPQDVEIAFAPDQGQTPIYGQELVKLIDKREPGWWNHYIFSRHIPKDDAGGWSLGPMIDLALPVAPHIQLVAYSQFHKQLIMDKWGHPAENITVIPNIVDPQLFTPKPKNSQITIGWIGYDHPSRWTKGVEVIPYLAKKFPKLQFEMVHALKPAHQKDWLKEPLSNVKVRYEIPHYQMPEVIAKWHVLTCGSKWETGATHVVEAMSCGVPVIAPGIGAIPEVAKGQMVLKDMKWSHPPHVEFPFNWTTESLERYAATLEEILSSPEKYNRLVEAAIQQSKQADPRRIAQLWFNFIYKCRSTLSQ